MTVRPQKWAFLLKNGDRFSFNHVFFFPVGLSRFRFARFTCLFLFSAWFPLTHLWRGALFHGLRGVGRDQRWKEGLRGKGAAKRPLGSSTVRKYITYNQ